MKRINLIFLVAALAVAVLSVFYWRYYVVSNGSVNGQGQGNFGETKVVKYAPPADLPPNVQDGYCWVNSVAEPYRADAWRCMIGSDIKDPCFSVPNQDTVICDINPFANTAGEQLLLTKPLPAPQVTAPAKDNWGWLIELSDETLCAPFTGTVPVINGVSAPYACTSDVQGQTALLVGDLKIDKIWTATKDMVIVDNGNIDVKSTAEVKIMEVWQ